MARLPGNCAPAPTFSARPVCPAREKFFTTMQRRLLLPILAAACLASLGVLLPRAGGGLSALPCHRAMWPVPAASASLCRRPTGSNRSFAA